MFKRLFVDHPKSVDENYIEHFGVASKFGVTMIYGGLCALVHAVVPGWCITTGSDTIQRLNHIMVEKRRAKGQAVMQMSTIDWVIRSRCVSSTHYIPRSHRAKSRCPSAWRKRDGCLDFARHERN